LNLPLYKGKSLDSLLSMKTYSLRTFISNSWWRSF
jgi:hypothetical protein